MDSEALYGLVFILGYIFIVGGIPVFLARNKNRGILIPFLLGILLGPIGWLIAALMKPPLSQEEQDILRQKMQNRSSGNYWT